MVWILKEFLKGFIPSKLAIIIALISITIGIIVGIVAYFTNYLTFGNELSPLLTSSIEIKLIFLKNIIFNNVTVSFIAIIFGELIIVPYIILVWNFIDIGIFNTFMFLNYGLKSLLILHSYFEIWAFILTLDSAMKISNISLKYYRKNLNKSDVNLKKIIINELISVFPRILLLLIIASLLETFWSPLVLNELFMGV